jgi:hypothetical protein
VTYTVVDYASNGEAHKCGEESFRITVLAPSEEQPAGIESEVVTEDIFLEKVQALLIGLLNTETETETETATEPSENVQGDTGNAQSSQEPAETSGGGGMSLLALISVLLMRIWCTEKSAQQQ